MKVTVLGATGTIGTLIVARLHEFGHDVVAASRSSGVDAVTGDGLDEALAGADAVVDCLNIASMSTVKALEFFTTTAGNVSAAARRAGVGRIVCVSIAGATDPAVNKGYGYYRGKAAQEHAYRSSGLPLTIIHSTQWFELMSTIVQRTTVGPVSFIPTMRMAAVAAGSVAHLVVDEVARTQDGPGGARSPSGDPKSPRRRRSRGRSWPSGAPSAARARRRSWRRPCSAGPSPAAG